MKTTAAIFLGLAVFGAARPAPVLGDLELREALARVSEEVAKLDPVVMKRALGGLTTRQNPAPKAPASPTGAADSGEGATEITDGLEGIGALKDIIVPIAEMVLEANYLAFSAVTANCGAKPTSGGPASDGPDTEGLEIEGPATEGPGSDVPAAHAPPAQGTGTDGPGN